MSLKPLPSSTEQVYALTAQSVAPGVHSVLILEDDLDFAEILRVFLEDHSFKVVRAANGVDGLRQVMSKDFDVILCDLMMPNLPGDKFHLAVQRAKQHLCKRFIFMTGHKADPGWAGFLSKVSGPVLGKPFSLDELLSTIQTLLTERALSSSSEE